MGLLLLGILVLFVLLGPMLLVDPNLSHLQLDRSATGTPPGPSWSHPLGTDTLFRDLLSRLASGGRLSLLIALGATTLALGIGTALGLVAGHFQRQRPWVGVLMRFVDLALAFPYLLLITAIGVALEETTPMRVVLVLGLTGWVGIARLVHAKARQTEAQPHIEAARALGLSEWRVMWQHNWPSLRSTLWVLGSQSIAGMILAEAVLGYLTVGVAPPEASWGRMLHEAEHYIGIQPLMVAAPGIAILLTVLAFTRLADAMRETERSTRSLPEAKGLRSIPIDLLLVGVAALLLLVFGEPASLAAPAPAMASSTRPRAGGTLRLATRAKVHHMDPAIAYDEASRIINQLLFSTLVQADAQGAIRPDLCASFAMSNKGHRFSCRLRPGLRFHDGSLVDAAAAKRSLERSLNPKTPSPGASSYRGIVGYDEFRKGRSKHLRGIVAKGLDLRIDLQSPDASFASRMSLGFAAPVCPNQGNFANPRKALKPCGAGPFRLHSFERGQRIVLRRFDRYYAPARIERIHWSLGMPSRTMRHLFEQGELDIVSELTGIDTARYASDPRFKDHRHWYSKDAVHGIFMNTAMPPFNNRHLRRAVAFAVDSSVLPKIAPRIAAATQLVPRSLLSGLEPQLQPRFDPARARAEMKLAGFPYDPKTARGGFPDTIAYLTTPNSFDQHAAEIYQQQLARIGIRIRIELTSWASWLARISKPNTVAMGWRGWQADYPDPIAIYEPTLTSGAISPNASQNVSFFRSRVFDQTIADAQRETVARRRKELFLRAEQIVAEEAPWVPTYHARTLRLWNSRLHDFQSNVPLALAIRTVWIASKKP